MKIAIVTGASSGIGCEFVKQIGTFYHSLDEVWVIARRRERLEALQEECAIPLRIFEGDLLKRSVYQELKRALKEEAPDLRMLINAAGFGKSGTVEELLAEDKNAQLEMIDLNCMAVSRMVFFCLPYMSRGSRILNIASAAAFSPQPMFAVYAATKAYVLSFSRALGEELKPRGIVVTAVCPGPVDTEFFDVSGRTGNVMKQLSMADATDVVWKALCDCRKKKAVSVYGMPIHFARVASKFLPQGLIVRIQAMANKRGESELDETM